MPIRILSVEDHPVVRAGLATLIASQPDMLLVAQAETGEAGIAFFETHLPDITLMDVRLPGMNGVDALLAIRDRFPHARVIMLTTAESDADVQTALRAGAAAYILKSAPRNELFAAIRRVHSEVD